MMGAVAEKKGLGEVAGTIAGQKRRAEQDLTTVTTFASSLASGLASSASEPAKEPAKKSRKHAASDVDLEIESLLNQQSTKEQQSKKVGTTRTRSHSLVTVLICYCLHKEYFVELRRRAVFLNGDDFFYHYLYPTFGGFCVQCYHSMVECCWHSIERGSGRWGLKLL
jgi:hypothetical protein